MCGGIEQLRVKVEVSAAQRETERPRALLRAVVALVAEAKEKERARRWVQ